MALPRPARRCPPAAFFEQYIPQVWTALVGQAPLPGQSLAAELVAHIDGHGVYTLRLADGHLTVIPAAPSGSPLLQVRCNSSSYQTAMREFLPRLLDQLDARSAEVQATAPKVLALWTPAQQAALLQLPGSITISYTDDAGDVATFELLHAGGQGPRAHVHLSDSDVQTLLASRGGPQALLRARVRIEGDTGYVMRLLQQVPNP